MPEFLLKISPVYENGDARSVPVKIAIRTRESIIDFQYGITPQA